MKRILFIAALAAVNNSVFLLAQNSGGGNSGGSNTGSQAASNANAGAQSVINNNQRGAYNFVSAVPGGSFGTTGVIPGPTYQAGSWTLISPLLLEGYSFEDFERMRHGGGCSVKSEWSLMQYQPYGSSFRWTHYNPLQVSNQGDKIVAEVTVTGKFLKSNLPCIAEGVHRALTKTNGHVRLAAGMRELNNAKHGGFTVGVGASGGRVTQPEMGNDPVDVAIGGSYGRTSSHVEDYPEFDIYVLNDGPIEPPPSAAPPQVAQSGPLPPPPVQTVRVEIPPIVVRVEPAPLPALPVQQAPTPAPQPAPEPEQACGSIPQLTVLFAFDSDVVKPEFFGPVREMVGWVNSHPKCKIEVQGYTCRSGPYDYDAGLALRRAHAVYDKLVEYGIRREQLKRYVSGGKDYPLDPTAPMLDKFEAPSRRVILQPVTEPASGR